MTMNLLVIIGTQLLFTASDVMGRANMKTYGFTAAAFTAGWFWIYLSIRMVATMGQLWVFASVDLGKTMALFAAASVVLSNVLGVLLLKEVLSITGYIGVSLAIVTLLVMALGK